MTDPAGKTILITGAGGGFGRQMVIQFRGAGARLVLTDYSESLLNDVVDESGTNLIASVVADLATAEGCDAVARLCSSHDIVPDILVNNAGIGVAGRLDDIPREQWETLMQLNLLAPMRLCNLLVPQMIERGSGHVVNISSLAGWVGSPGLSAYCASKFGLRGFGESLAADLEDTGVVVTNIFPCFARTPILESIQHGYDEPRVPPDYLVSDPSGVVANMIKGIRRNRRQVFPDKYSRRIHYVTRFLPWLVPYLNRRMQAESIEEGRKQARAAATRDGTH